MSMATLTVWYFVLLAPLAAATHQTDLAVGFLSCALISNCWRIEENRSERWRKLALSGGDLMAQASAEIDRLRNEIAGLRLEGEEWKDQS